jgi:hypothetical protein
MRKKYYPPVNYKPFTVYLTPAQRKKIEKLTAAEGKKHGLKLSLSDYIRLLIDKQ